MVFKFFLCLCKTRSNYCSFFSLCNTSRTRLKNIQYEELVNPGYVRVQKLKKVVLFSVPLFGACKSRFYIGYQCFLRFFLTCRILTFLKQKLKGCSEETWKLFLLDDSGDGFKVKDIVHSFEPCLFTST